jgi:hypothetical protein
MKEKLSFRSILAHVVIQRIGKYLPLAAMLSIVVTLGSGCVTNGRRVLLKEYGPGIPQLSDVNLKGATICIKDFNCAPDMNTFEIKTKPEEPQPFKYMDLTHEQDMVWDKEMHALDKTTGKGDLREIGNMRDGFGIVMSHVYALNDPATWLAQGLTFDLEAQGAKVVDASQAADADVAVSATIHRLFADMYMTESSHLVVDLDVQPRQGQARHKQIHTHGATAAMLASEGEYFHAFRDAREKFSILVAREISEALKTRPQTQSAQK